MRTLIVEDEPVSSDSLKEMLQRTGKGIEVVAVLRTVRDALNFFEKNPSPDLIFLDIKLQDGSSFAIFDSIEITTPIVFTTSYDEYAVEAFKHNSIGYLLKPIKYEDLVGCLTKIGPYGPVLSMEVIKQVREVMEQNKAHKTRLLSKVNNNIHIINVDDIEYIHSRFRGVFSVSAKGKKFLLNYTLNQLEEILDPKKFFRANRTFIISIDSIDQVSTHSSSRLNVVLKNFNERILIPKEKVEVFKKWLES